MSSEISPKRMEEIDLLYKTPAERAEEVNAIFQRAAKELELDH